MPSSEVSGGGIVALSLNRRFTAVPGFFRTFAYMKEPRVYNGIERPEFTPELFFYVTRIGCGIAGFRDKEIAPLFSEAVGLENVCLPESFVKVLKLQKTDAGHRLSE